MTLPVSEVYGPVLQGEGPYMGRPVWFLRLGLCNLACRWCDTPYTWDRERFDVDVECPPTTAAQVLTQLPDDGVVVLSGGEPLMHRGNDTLREVLTTSRCEIHVETNGTLAPSGWLAQRVSWWSVSPKLSHSGDRQSKRIKPDVLRWFTAMDNVGFKFVAGKPSDLDEIAALVQEFQIPKDKVWVMPEGVTADAQLDTMRALYEPVLARGWSLAPRLHVLIHGNRRGV